MLFLSDRTGAFGVWSQPFAERPAGAPKLLKADVGDLDVIGVTVRRPVLRDQYSGQAFRRQGCP